MYAYITGKIAEKSPTYVVLDNQGIGYFVNITLNTFTAIGEKEEAKLFVHEQILEDAHNLFGFYSAKERDLFDLLISVSGVGCNTARLILSSLTVNELSNAIANDDVKTIQAVKGIGAKTAQRIVIDLKDKLKKNDFPMEIFAAPNNTIKTEALSALTILGFSKMPPSKLLSKKHLRFCKANEFILYTRYKKAECRMRNAECGMPFIIRHSSFIIHNSFPSRFYPILRSPLDSSRKLRYFLP